MFIIKKLIDVGIQAIRNEAEDIRGWAKTMLFFCKKVYAIIDPDSTDATESILKTEFPEINILYQDKSLGDSDDGHQGEKGELSCHYAVEYWVNKLVKKNQWFLWLSPDERISPLDWDIVYHHIYAAQKQNYDSLWFTHLVQYYPDEQHEIDFSSIMSPEQNNIFRFQKRFEYWGKNKPAHSGLGSGVPRFRYKCDIPFFHYNWVKTTRKAFGLWRDQQELRNLPVKKTRYITTGWRDYTGLKLDSFGHYIHNHSTWKYFKQWWYLGWFGWAMKWDKILFKMWDKVFPNTPFYLSPLKPFLKVKQ